MILEVDFGRTFIAQRHKLIEHSKPEIQQALVPGLNAGTATHSHRLTFVANTAGLFNDAIHLQAGADLNFLAGT